MSAFSEDTAVEPAGEGRWRGELTDRWQTPGGTPNGGYVLSVSARAMAAALPHPHPASITGHYLAPPTAGPVELEVEVVRAGRRHSTATCRLLQDGREVLRSLATFTDLSRADGPTHVAEPPPPLPPRDECKRISGGDYPDAPALLQRFDWATPEEFLGFMRGEKSGRGVNGGWIRFADADETDPLAPVLLADAFAPPVFNLEGVTIGWVPTVELTVHVRKLLRPGWLRGWFRTSFLTNGYLEEDGQIWDDEDDVVALSRQLALAPRPPRPDADT